MKTLLLTLAATAALLASCTYVEPADTTDSTTTTTTTTDHLTGEQTVTEETVTTYR